MHLTTGSVDGLIGYARKFYTAKVPPRCKEGVPLYTSKFEWRCVYE